MKKILIPVVIVIVVIVAFLAMRMQKPATVEPEESDAVPTTALPTVSETVKVELTPKSGGQAVVLKISGLTADMEAVEYELTYTTAAGLPRGVLGKIQLKGETEVTRDDIVMGTCSSGKCVYDTGVTAVNLTLKFHTAAGASVFQKTYSLE